MKNFEYAAPSTETEVLGLLSDEPGRTELLAGGTDLVGLLKKMVLMPDRVVNIMEVPTLRQIERHGDGSLWIGSCVTLDDLLDTHYLGDYPAVEQAIRGINSMQLQAQGTIGGEICQRARCWFFRNGYGLLADDGASVAEGDNRHHAIFGNSGPAKFLSGSRIAPALLALGAVMRIVGPGEQDEVLLPADALFRTPRHAGQRETVLEPRQLLTHIVLPPATGEQSATYEVRHSEGPDYPLAAAAACLRLEGGAVSHAKVVLGQVAPVPWVAPEAAQALIGQHVTPEVARSAGQAAVARATPLSGNEYKVHLAKVAVERSVLLAAGLETGGF